MLASTFKRIQLNAILCYTKLKFKLCGKKGTPKVAVQYEKELELPTIKIDQDLLFEVQMK